MKVDLFHDYRWHRKTELAAAVEDYLKFYNNDRITNPLGGLTIEKHHHMLTAYRVQKWRQNQMQKEHLCPAGESNESTTLITYVVERKDLATNWKNDIPVVATPVLVCLCEMPQ